MPQRRLLLDAALWAALLGTIGCQSARRGSIVAEVESRYLEVVDPGAEDGNGPERLPPPERATLQISLDELHVEANFLVVVDAPEDEGDTTDPPELRRASSVILYDFLTRSVWAAMDDAPFERRTFAEVAYEEANEIRRARLDFINAVLLVPGLRAAPRLELYSGDLRLEDTGERATFAGKDARHVRIAAVPTFAWDAVVSSDPALLPEPWQRERWLAGALELSPQRARLLIERLGGVPVKIKVRGLPFPGGQVAIEHTLVRYDEADGGDSGRRPTAIDREGAQRVDLALGTPEAILDFIESPPVDAEEILRFVSGPGVFLRLSSLLRPDLAGRVARLCASLEDGASQVELARALLRHDAALALSRLRGLVLGPEGARAMNVVEALVAEENDRALDALFVVLERRNEYADVEGGAVAAWAVQHIRLLSGITLERLLEIFPSPSSAEDAAAALPGEVDHWLRWWESERTRHPRI
ncbi:MAG TPA: hypothetical protein VMT52_07480 [Planctomycetota bacterium]|nr:hypothetical protein [Planctomycetota bacterium]